MHQKKLENSGFINIIPRKYSSSTDSMADRKDNKDLIMKKYNTNYNCLPYSIFVVTLQTYDLVTFFF